MRAPRRLQSDGHTIGDQPAIRRTESGERVPFGVWTLVLSFSSTSSPAIHRKRLTRTLNRVFRRSVASVYLFLCIQQRKGGSRKGREASHVTTDGAQKRALALTEEESRSNNGCKKSVMKVMLSSSSGETLEVSRGDTNGHVQPLPPLDPSPFFESNGESEAPSEPGSAEIEYVVSEDLKDLADADVQLATLLERLDSKEWLVVCEALTHTRQLSIFHSELLVPILDAVVALVIKSVKNPRSALCKTALMTSKDMFKAYQDQLLDLLDPLLLQLLLKASQDKRFVCEEAERTLIGMTTSISPQPMLQKLQPYVSHRNPRVRAKAAVCVYKSVSRLGVDGIKQYGMELLIQLAAAQLNDRLPEAREVARKLVVDLCTAYHKCPPDAQSMTDFEAAELDFKQQDPWEQFCLSKLSPIMAQAVLRVTCIAT
ncbi:hypothetical protein BDL97_03G057200 [Sphagnum fallax]|nr:hypothetical protein BDL97_03G057200 [Sphagnum fallax]